MHFSETTVLTRLEQKIRLWEITAKEWKTNDWII